MSGESLHFHWSEHLLSSLLLSFFYSFIFLVSSLLFFFFFKPTFFSRLPFSLIFFLILSYLSLLLSFFSDLLLPLSCFIPQVPFAFDPRLPSLAGRRYLAPISLFYLFRYLTAPRSLHALLPFFNLQAQAQRQTLTRFLCYIPRVHRNKPHTRTQNDHAHGRRAKLPT